jgi:hypothetical protein
MVYNIKNLKYKGQSTKMHQSVLYQRVCFIKWALFDNIRDFLGILRFSYAVTLDREEIVFAGPLRKTAQQHW